MNTRRSRSCRLDSRLGGEGNDQRGWTPPRAAGCRNHRRRERSIDAQCCQLGGAQVSQGPSLFGCFTWPDAYSGWWGLRHTGSAFRLVAADPNWEQPAALHALMQVLSNRLQHAQAPAWAAAAAVWCRLLPENFVKVEIIVCYRDYGQGAAEEGHSSPPLQKIKSKTVLSGGT